MTALLFEPQPWWVSMLVVAVPLAALVGVALLDPLVRDMLNGWPRLTLRALLLRGPWACWVVRAAGPPPAHVPASAACRTDDHTACTGTADDGQTCACVHHSLRRSCYR